MTQDDSDQQLVERVQAGDKSAFDLLVRKYQHRVLKLVSRFVSDAAEAEDVAQEAFLKAYRALGRFREGSPFRPWLLRIVANEARNRRRAAGRRAGLTLRAAAVVSGDAAPSPETTALTRERRDALLGGLAALDERDREVLVHRFLLELGEDETAAALGIRRGTVKSRTSRALDRLRAVVGEEVA